MACRRAQCRPRAHDGRAARGTLSLIRTARDECDRVVASIFVNPTQFGRGEDFDTYARPFERDAALLEQEGCDVIFAPGVEDMYGGTSLDLSPSGQAYSYVEAGWLGEVWEGETRPGHMRGVATVVAMLLNIARPHRAYFGEKDYQQLKLIERMVRDLFFGVEIVACPTVRDPDGLSRSAAATSTSPPRSAKPPSPSHGLCRPPEIWQPRASATRARWWRRWNASANPSPSWSSVTPASWTPRPWHRCRPSKDRRGL